MNKLVRLVNPSDEGTRVPIVLFVQGQILGGSLVSGKEGFGDLVGCMVTQVNGEPFDLAASLFEGEMENYAKPASEQSSVVSFLHLKDAYTVSALAVKAWTASACASTRWRARRWAATRSNELGGGGG